MDRCVQMRGVPPSRPRVHLEGGRGALRDQQPLAEPLALQCDVLGPGGGGKGRFGAEDTLDTSSLPAGLHGRLSTGRDDTASGDVSRGVHAGGPGSHTQLSKEPQACGNVPPAVFGSPAWTEHLADLKKCGTGPTHGSP